MMTVMGLILIVKLLGWLTSITLQPFFIGICVGLLTIKKLPKIFTMQPTLKMIRARILIRGSPNQIGKIIVDSYSKQN
jgi:hypothetical protein